MGMVSPPHYESRKMAQILTDTEKRLKRIEEGLRTGQLGNASIENGSILLNDANGVTRGQLGKVDDGTWGFMDTNNPNPPPTPSAPNVEATMAGLIVTHDGTTADGAGFLSDLSHLVVEYAPPSMVWAVAGTMQVGGNRGFPAKLPIAPLDYLLYSVRVKAVNFSKKISPESAVATGTPSQVVGEDIVAGIIDATKLAADAVTAAQLAAGAVTETKVAAGAISTPKLAVGAVQANNIAAGQIQASHLITGAVTAEKIQALAITGDKIAANSIESGKIAAGAITASKLDVNLVIAGRLIAGDPTGTRVEMTPTSGIQAFKDDGDTRTFWLDAATGAAFFMGELTTGLSGTSRIQINPSGTAPDTIRLWDTGTAWAEILATPAPGSTAAVFLRGSRSTTQNVRGNVAAYATEAFIALQNETSGGVTSQNTAVSCVQDTLNIWSGSMNIEGRKALGTGNIQFLWKNSSGTVISNLVLYPTGANQPAAQRGATDQVLTWSTSDMYSGDSAGNPRAFAGSPYVVVSSETTKKNIRARTSIGRRPDGTSFSYRELARAIEAKEFNYINERSPGEAPKPPQKITRKEIRRDSMGAALADPVTGKIIEDVIETLTEVQPEIKPHYFFIAEELLAVAPELVRVDPTKPGGYTISSADIDGFLFTLCKEQEAELVSLRADVQTLMNRTIR